MTTSRTYTPRASEIERSWFVVDAAGQRLGLLASRIAVVLEGKHKPTYATHIDTGDHVIVLNAAKIDGQRRQAAAQALRAPQRLSRAASARRRWRAARAPARRGHPPRRQGHAAAQQAGRPAAAQAEGLRGRRAPARGTAARAAAHGRFRPLMATQTLLLLRHRPAQDQRRPRPTARRRGRGRRQRPLARGALRQRRRPDRHHDALPGDQHRGPLQRHGQGRGWRLPRPGRRDPPRHRPRPAAVRSRGRARCRCARPAS